MEKPEVILELEEDLECLFDLVYLEEISEYKSDKTTEYSIDEYASITGIAICSFKLNEIPKSFSKTNKRH